MMPPVVHTILIHDPHIISNALLTIGQLSEHSQEARNKDILFIYLFTYLYIYLFIYQIAVVIFVFPYCIDHYLFSCVFYEFLFFALFEFYFLIFFNC